MSSLRKAGLAKREWFAGQALAGLFAASLDRLSPQQMAMLAFDLADRMIEESRK